MLCIFFYAGTEGDDDSVLNMIMHSHGSMRLPSTLTGSSAKMPNAEDYPPDGRFNN